jgi:phosphoribosylpyrophosphate synthetase
MGHKISAVSVKRLLPTLGYSRQTNRKADEGGVAGVVEI